jgi:hypothetical protein
MKTEEKPMPQITEERVGENAGSTVEWFTNLREQQKLLRKKLWFKMFKLLNTWVYYWLSA